MWTGKQLAGGILLGAFTLAAFVSVGGLSSEEERPIEWIHIPGGSFEMGSNSGYSSETPVHRVTVASFEISKSEITFGQYQSCVDAGECTAPHISDGSCWILDADGTDWIKGNLPSKFWGINKPVVCINWSEASTFASWAGARLATEAEWEYAARGKESFEFAGSSSAKEVGWHRYNSNNTHNVCTKEPNGYDLCDMSGNVFEWVQDTYHDSYVGAHSSSSAWDSGGSYRVIRGGSWDDPTKMMRVSYRTKFEPSNCSYFVGARLVRSIP